MQLLLTIVLKVFEYLFFRVLTYLEYFLFRVLISTVHLTVCSYLVTNSLLQTGAISEV